MNTTYFLNLVAGNVFGTKDNPGLPAKYYLGLSTTTPTVGGTGVSEPSASSAYSRIELTNLSAPNNGEVTNTSAIDFEESTGSWGTVTHYVIYDSATVGSGNLLVYGPLTSARSVEPGTIITIRTGNLKLSVVNPTT